MIRTLKDIISLSAIFPPEFSPYSRLTALQSLQGGHESGGCEVTINITDDPEVFCTRKELERYTAEWQQRFMMFAGERPTLAAFIEREQKRAKKPNGGYISNG